MLLVLARQLAPPVQVNESNARAATAAAATGKQIGEHSKHGVQQGAVHDVTSAVTNWLDSKSNLIIARLVIGPSY